MNNSMSRRSAIAKVAVGAAAVAVATKLSPASAAESATPAKLKGRINHSACKWCYGKIQLDDFCKAGKEIGLVAVDLLSPNEFETVKKHGLVCSMVSNPTIDGLGGITKGFNRRTRQGDCGCGFPTPHLFLRQSRWSRRSERSGELCHRIEAPDVVR
jgi:hydroxypyruvate isomerase